MRGRKRSFVWNNTLKSVFHSRKFTIHRPTEKRLIITTRPRCLHFHVNPRFPAVRNTDKGFMTCHGHCVRRCTAFRITFQAIIRLLCPLAWGQRHFAWLMVVQQMGLWSPGQMVLASSFCGEATPFWLILTSVRSDFSTPFSSDSEV